ARSRGARRIVPGAGWKEAARDALDPRQNRRVRYFATAAPVARVKPNDGRSATMTAMSTTAAPRYDSGVRCSPLAKAPKITAMTGTTTPTMLALVTGQCCTSQV